MRNAPKIIGNKEKLDIGKKINYNILMKIFYLTILLTVTINNIISEENSFINKINIDEEITFVFDNFLKDSLNQKLKTDGQLPYSIKYEEYNLDINNDNLTFYRMEQNYRDRLFIVTYDSYSLFEFYVYICILVLDQNNNILELNISRIRKDMETIFKGFPFEIKDGIPGTQCEFE
jgi:hypothetical protein